MTENFECNFSKQKYLYLLILAVSTPLCVKPAATCGETPCDLVDVDQNPTSYLRQQRFPEFKRHLTEYTLQIPWYYSSNISLFKKGESIFSPWYVLGQTDSNKCIRS